MQIRSRDIFTTIKTEGSLLPADLLQRIAQGNTSVDGLKPTDYHLAEGEKLNEAISHSWNRMLALWQGFTAAADKLTPTDSGTTPTRDRWLLPLFQELGYGRLSIAKAIEFEGKSYAVSHMWQNTPIHLVGCNIALDRRSPGVAGAFRTSPHSLVQELINRRHDLLWAFVSNGRRLRILRDNVSLTRQAFVEFDLAGMMDGEVYSDFVLLWLLCHQSRVEGETPQKCWLEKWSQSAQEQGTRALDTLRKGVEDAIVALGSGFLLHKANAALREKLQSGTLDKQDYYRQLLRMVYRLIFLFAAEDRGLLLAPTADPAAKETYTRYYSAARLRRLAARRRQGGHPDLWRGLRLVFEKLGAKEGCPELALPSLGSFLWSPDAAPDLHTCDIANADLLDAFRHLSYTVDGKNLRSIDYKNLGPEELGSIYESLLELHPQLTVGVGQFELSTASGHERKTTGSYYTPTSLINCLLDSALEPVIADAMAKKDAAAAEKAILALKVVDPACGSGHFLVAAAHRIAKRLAAIRTGDDEPSPEFTRAALRDVIGKCIYGVDINPMSVELCKINLWMEALEPGKPLSFLDHHIKCGNSLLGTTPALLDKGIPDEAFSPIEGDDKKYCSEFKKQNKDERKGQMTWQLDFGGETSFDKLGNLATAVARLDDLEDDTPEEIEVKRSLYEQITKSSDYLYGHFLADAWCAAFVWKKTKEFGYPVTEQIFRNIEKNPHSVPPWLRDEVMRLAKAYQFFHWHIEFPSVFRVPSAKEKPDNEQTGWSGGFDCVLGNPPWEHTELKEKEWFDQRYPAIASARTGDERKRMIDQLRETNPLLFAQFTEARRAHDNIGFFVGGSGRYPLCGRGRINTYAVFAELKRDLLSATGRVGCVIPSGIATDDTTKFFFQDVVETKSLVSLFDFENKLLIFPSVAPPQKFCLFTLTGLNRPHRQAEFVFFAHEVGDLAESDCRFILSAEDIALLNPNTRTCPIFRSRHDAELTKHIYRRVPIVIREAHDGQIEQNPWGIKFKQGLFNMTSDSHLFRTREQLEDDGWTLRGNIFEKDGEQCLPLYEAKMFHQFEHRYNTYDGVPPKSRFNVKAYALPFEDKSRDPKACVLPRYWIQKHEVSERWVASALWMIVFRDITNVNTNRRTAVFSVLPFVGVGHVAPVLLPGDAVSKRSYTVLLQNLNAFAFDYCCRQSLGGSHLTFFILKQLPLLRPDDTERECDWLGNRQTILQWVLPHVLELTYTAWDLEPFARDCGYEGPPFIRDEDRRFKIRAELDAAFFHLYLGTDEEWQKQGTPELLAAFPTPRHAVDYIMDTFPIVKRRDEKEYGSYRTKELILDVYDKMAEAIRTSTPYKTILDPLPGPPCDAAGSFIPMAQWDPNNWPKHIHRLKGDNR